LKGRSLFNNRFPIFFKGENAEGELKRGEASLTHTNSPSLYKGRRIEGVG